MTKKKIIYVTPAMPVGGAERFLISLTGAIRSFTSGQWIVSLSDRNALQAEVPEGVHFLVWPRKSKFDREPVMNLRKLFLAEKPEIVFCINFFAYIIARAALRGTRLKPRIIISYHSTKYFTRKEHWMHHIYARMLRKSDEIVCVSRNQADYTARTFLLPRKRFKVILNCVDNDFWKPYSDPSERMQIRKEWGIPPDAKVIILTAAMRPEKNHVGAIRALQMLHENKGIPAYLLIVGDGIMRPVIEQAKSLSPVKDFIIMTGMQLKVKPFYYASDIFTLVSDNVETFSIAALEAMACGLPLCLTRVGGASEMVDENVNGFLTNCDTESLCEGWQKTLDANFDRFLIHDYARRRFGKDRMVDSYKELLEL